MVACEEGQMSVTTSYPGVYIQELPSLVHNIQPAPTSIAVFVGYTNPFFSSPLFPTQYGQFGQAVQLFSFADYQANFGGFFYSPWLQDYVGQAVYQFFLNGGQTCYVVGLRGQTYYQGTAPSSAEVLAATASVGGITFTALQPVANTPALPQVGTGTADAEPSKAADISKGADSTKAADISKGADKGKDADAAAQAAPTVTSITPTTGSPAGGNTVTVTGTGFTHATSVQFGSVSATNLVILNDTQLTVTSPAPASSAANDVDVTVTSGGQTSVTPSPGQFTYAVKVTGIDPASGSPAGGDTVTVTGTGFTGATSVQFDSVSAPSLVILSDTRLAVTSPLLPSSATNDVVNVTVTSGGQTSVTPSPGQFTYADIVGIPMQVQFTNLQPGTSPTTADIVITYGTTVETYRKVSIANLQATEAVQGGGSALPSVSPALQNSALVTVAVDSATLPTIPEVATLTYGENSTPLAGWTLISPGDFGAVFQDGAPLDKVPIFNLLVTPGITDNSVTSEAVAYCERKRAFYIMDTPSPDTGDWKINDLVQDIGSGALSLSSNFPVSTNAALYYPWLSTTNPVTGAPSFAPPSGFVAGMYGQEDNNFGVWKSPAGIETTLLGTTGVHPNGVMTDPQQGVLNQNALDCIRQFPGIGTVIFGARTTAGADANTAQQQWKYVAVRRTALFIEQSLYASLTWAVFQGNSTPLWKALTQEVTAFMLTLFRQGAFAGDTPSQAFVVQCDSTTTTAQDISNGVVNILVGFAPLVPAEFVVVQIAQLAGQAQS
jgi:uncharacterized protein